MTKEVIYVWLVLCGISGVLGYLLCASGAL